MKNPSILARLFRPLIKSSLADPGPDIFAQFGIVGPISSAEALRVPAVGSAIRLISGVAASLDVQVKARQADGSEVEVRDHPASTLLTGFANDWTSGFDFVRDLVIDALTDDRGGLAWVNRLGDGRPYELIRFRSGVFNVDYNQTTGEPIYRIENRLTPAADVIHLRAPFGKAPPTLAREGIAVARALASHAEKLFGRGARPSGALIFPKGMGEESVKKARKAWRETHEGEDSGGATAILYDGADYKPYAFASTDAQFIENRMFQIYEIARAFGVPPSMLFALDRATYANGEQQGMDFLINCLELWLKGREGALARALLTREERADGLVIRFDRDDLTRADLTARATAINSLIASEVLNPNEGRGWIGLGPYAGGDKFGNRNINPDQGGRPTSEEVPPNAV
ncbi:phage portal protein [Pseudogemmobacter faecipullorum]|uniref:Phage portal protein n=1 Tax=Pseudogemmobacter faecipullorum TaxID=2755041 RepID=A0ABS8CNS7_9RHOB|nr:phage portal protein [Pseudogemmobacter faecipullorum]MCB5411029.1 phage portal protein [Pseudogemmobacter faecipullorum]